MGIVTVPSYICRAQMRQADEPFSLSHLSRHDGTMTDSIESFEPLTNAEVLRRTNQKQLLSHAYSQ